MAIVVEHDKRKSEILEKSLELFCSEGFDDVTFQKIADACGVTRTTLYIYFKNKQEIFVWSIRHLTNRIEKELLEIIEDETIPPDECLKKVVCCIVSECGAHYRLFKVLLPYLLSIEKSGINPGERVRRRVIRIKHFLNMIIINGQNAGVFKKVPIKVVNDMFYSMIETTMYRIAIMDKFDVKEIFDVVNLCVDGITISRS
nr:TetR/AcrR family transcriptional regulator [Treponema sp.]